MHVLVPTVHGFAQRIGIEFEFLRKFRNRIGLNDPTPFHLVHVRARPDVSAVFDQAEIPRSKVADRTALRKPLVVEDRVAGNPLEEKITPVVAVDRQNARVTFNGLLIHKALRRAVDENVAGRVAAEVRCCELPRDSNAERSIAPHHVPNVGSDGLGKSNAVARISRTTERINGRTFDAVDELALVKLETAACQNHAFLRADAHGLARAFRENAGHLALSVRTKALYTRFQIHRDLAYRFHGVAVYRPQVRTAAAARPGRLGGYAPFIHRIGAGNLRIAGVSVDAHFGTGLERFDPLNQFHRLFDEDVKARFIEVGRIRVKKTAQVLSRFRFVVRIENSSRGDSRIAAAFLHFFENADLGPRIMSGNRRAGAGTAVTDHDDVEGFIPMPAFFRSAGYKRKPKNRGGHASDQRTAIDVHDFPFI